MGRAAAVGGSWLWGEGPKDGFPESQTPGAAGKKPQDWATALALSVSPEDRLRQWVVLCRLELLQLLRPWDGAGVGCWVG